MVRPVETGSGGGVHGLDPRLTKATQEFEGMLLSQLLKVGGDDDQSSEDGLNVGSESYESLRNQAVATALANKGGIGIARMLQQRFSRLNQD